MRFGIATIVLSLAAFAPAGSACAMNSPTPLVDCRVIDGAKLPAASGGPEALCSAIRQAAAEQAPDKHFSVEVRVLGESMLAATVTTADGQALPEQKLTVSDRALSRSSLERFARNLAGEMARAANR